MDEHENRFMYLPIMIGEHFHSKYGNGIKGILVYYFTYFCFSTLLSILTNGIDIWVLEEMIPSIINCYFFLGMNYVFFYRWEI